MYFCILYQFIINYGTVQGKIHWTRISFLSEHLIHHQFQYWPMKLLRGMSKTILTVLWRQHGLCRWGHKHTADLLWQQIFNQQKEFTPWSNLDWNSATIKQRRDFHDRLSKYYIWCKYTLKGKSKWKLTAKRAFTDLRLHICQSETIKNPLYSRVRGEMWSESKYKLNILPTFHFMFWLQSAPFSVKTKYLNVNMSLNTKLNVHSEQWVVVICDFTVCSCPSRPEGLPDPGLIHQQGQLCAVHRWFNSSKEDVIY